MSDDDLNPRIFKFLPLILGLTGAIYGVLNAETTSSVLFDTCIAAAFGTGVGFFGYMDHRHRKWFAALSMFLIYGVAEVMILTSKNPSVVGVLLMPILAVITYWVITKDYPERD